MLHLAPFHCSISVLPPGAEVAPMSSPTAQASVAEMAVTALIVGVLVPGCCIGTTAQAVPLKCSASAVVVPVVVLTVVPTTQMSVAESAEMDWPAPGVKSGSGMVTELHAEPFQCSRSALLPSPTAQASVGLRSATPVSSATKPVTTSEEFTDHAVPFQCSISVPSSCFPRTLIPTAQASVGLLALTESRLEVTPRVGVATSDHLVPFQL